MEMELDSGHYQVFVDVVQALVAAGLGIGLWILKKSQVNAERINDLESDLDKRLEGQGRQVARIEETLKHYPNRDDLGKLHSRIDQVASGMSELTGEFRAVRRSLDMIQEFLLHRKGQ